MLGDEGESKVRKRKIPQGVMKLWDLEVFKARAGENHPITICIL